MVEKIIIVAASENDGIGIDGRLPWNIPEDKARFKELTRGKTVVQGKDTYESILGYLGKPLPGRTNIVLSTTLNSREGIYVARTMDEALRIAEAERKDVYFIGGRRVYAEALRIADKMELTRVQGKYECDVFLPEIDWNVWNLVNEQARTNPDGISFSFETYQRMR